MIYTRKFPHLLKITTSGIIFIGMNYIFGNTTESEELKNRFVKYAKIWSESNGELADKGIFPSTERQWDMAKNMIEELNAMGLQNVQLTDKCYVYANLPGNGDSVLLMAHMDTVDEVTGQNVNPVITQKDDDTIISSDHSTLLGGDDKAGIAAIMTALAWFKKHPEKQHHPVEVIFSPDEETGHGMDFVPLNLIKSKRAYTVDGGDEGEMETECFNAWSATVSFTGKACHTGDAKKGKMVNASLIASEFVNQLPQNMRPETTENHEGFIAVMKMSSCIENSEVELLLRSFSLEEINEEKRIIEKAAFAAAQKFGGIANVLFNQQYLNMKEKLDSAPQVVAELEKAYEAANVKIIRKPIRGGTDGSRLTEMGIPTPNIFTGAHEYHSRNEWVSLNQMSKAADILINLLLAE